MGSKSWQALVIEVDARVKRSCDNRLCGSTRRLRDASLPLVGVFAAA
jgi:hypothetical protein